MKYLYFLLISIFSFINAQAQTWKLLHPENGDPNDIFRVIVPKGTEKFYTWGYTLSTSDDKGQTWQKEDYSLKLNPSPTYKDIYFTSVTTGFIIDRNTIIKTTNKGKTWKTVSQLSPNNRFQTSAYLEKFYFLDQKVGYAVGPFDKLLKTTDEGEHWQVLQWTTSATPYTKLDDVYFWNEQKGMITGYTVDDIFMNFGRSFFVKLTMDGGRSWQTVYENKNDNYSKGKINVIDDKVAYILLEEGLEAHLIKTTNGGGTWENAFPLPSNFTDITMQWTDELHGYLIGTYSSTNKNILYKTVDGGQNWIQEELPSNVYDITFLDKQIGVMVGESGSILRTDNGGTTWTTQQKGYNYVNSLHKFSATYYLPLNDGTLLQSDDLNNWNTSAIKWPQKMQRLEQISEDSIYGIGGDVEYYRDFIFSSNGGKDWDKLIDDPNVISIDVKYNQTTQKIWVLNYHFVDNTCFVSVIDTKTNSIQKHQVFKDQQYPYYYIYNLGLLHNNEAVVVTSDHIYTSQGNGTSWSKTYSGAPNSALLKPNAVKGTSIVYVWNSTSEYVKSSDNGRTWQQQKKLPQLFAEANLSFHFVTEKIGFAYGSAREADTYWENVILETIDGGETWNQARLPLLLTGYFTGMKQIGNKIYVYGKGGVLLERTVPHSQQPSPSNSDIKIISLATHNAIKIIHPFPSVQIAIYSSNGQLLAQYQNVSTGSTIDLSSYPKQVFIVKAFYNNQEKKLEKAAAF
jgi:photosystem II stability/assembly factor-like uncharacterized protein